MNQDYLNKLSEDILLKVKMEETTSAIRLELESLDLNVLHSSLSNDHKKIAFWINVYNAYYQIIRKEENLSKSAVYNKKLFSIAGELLSLDDVEHGILRRYRYKYSLGYFSNLFASKFVKKHAVEKLDYRIHFALNCGAESCPPIAFYNVKDIDEQLTKATQEFLEVESDFDDQKKIVFTTALFKWFYADFGGNNGIKKIYKEQLNRDISNYKIKFKKYSWEDNLNNFVPDA